MQHHPLLLIIPSCTWSQSFHSIGGVVHVPVVEVKGDVVGPDQAEELLVPIKQDKSGYSPCEVEADGQPFLLLLHLPVPRVEVGAKFS